jgi:hypothetical protein
MALYSLKKKPVVIKDDMKEDVASSNQVTLWEGIEKKKRFISRSLSDSKWTGFFIPLLFILAGAYLLLSQLFPEVLGFIQSRFANNSDNISVVSDDYYKDKINMISSPQSGYFSEVLAHSLTLKVKILCYIF